MGPVLGDGGSGHKDRRESGRGCGRGGHCGRGWGDSRAVRQRVRRRGRGATGGRGLVGGAPSPRSGASRSRKAPGARERERRPGPLADAHFGRGPPSPPFGMRSFMRGPAARAAHGKPTSVAFLRWGRRPHLRNGVEAGIHQEPKPPPSLRAGALWTDCPPQPRRWRRHPGPGSASLRHRPRPPPCLESEPTPWTAQARCARAHPGEDSVLRGAPCANSFWGPAFGCRASSSSALRCRLVFELSSHGARGSDGVG